MRLSTKIQFDSPLLRQPSRLRPALAKVVAEVAFEIERDVKERMRAPKSGRTYRRGVLGQRVSAVTRGLGLRERTTRGPARQAIAGYRFHRASAPGEAPAVDQGLLISSINTRVNGLRATIGSSVGYAAALEFGGRRVAARPAFKPALERARPNFERKVSQAIGGLI